MVWECFGSKDPLIEAFLVDCHRGDRGSSTKVSTHSFGGLRRKNG